ncbi:hypothetical protein KEM48_002238 [Puccinia striiformis f. sp. tritici PST-130]|nr:hypothetical protein KEM48_002238 [Puccinia striiformis f. sp. tritici PST-130]
MEWVMKPRLPSVSQQAPSAYSHQHLGTLAGADELGGLVSRLLPLDPKATEENIALVESLGIKPTTIDKREAVPGWSEDVSIIQVAQMLISF